MPLLKMHSLIMSYYYSCHLFARAFIIFRPTSPSSFSDPHTPSSHFIPQIVSSTMDSFDSIPFPQNKILYNADIPVNLRDTRLAIAPGNLMNASNLMYDYLEQICSFVYKQSGSELNSLSELVEKAKTVLLVNDEKSKACPWSNYPIPQSLSSWSLYDELCTLIVSSGLIYHQIALNTISKGDDSRIGDLVWKKAVNCLQQSSSLTRAFKPYITAAPHSDNILYVEHLNSTLLQITVVMRNIETQYVNLNTDDDILQSASRSNAIFIRILVFIYNEAVKLESSPSPMHWEMPYECYKKFLEVLLCYYSGLNEYGQNKMGVALALTEYGILAASEQSKTKARLGIRSRKVLSGSKIRESKLWRDEVILRKNFKRHLPDALQRTLTETVKLLRVMYVRFEKMNTTLNFDEVPKMEEIEEKHLFSSDSLPGGMAVPVSRTKQFRPTCLGGKEFSERKYY